MRNVLVLLLLATMLPLQAAWAVAGLCPPGRGHGLHAHAAAPVGAVHHVSHEQAASDHEAAADSLAHAGGAAAPADPSDESIQAGGECVHATAVALLPSFAVHPRPPAAVSLQARLPDSVVSHPGDRLYRPPRVLPA